jgi:hypothetical protein
MLIEETMKAPLISVPIRSVYRVLLVPAPQVTLICIKEALLCHKNEGIKIYNHQIFHSWGKKAKVRWTN